MPAHVAHQAGRFIIVGAIGFVVDGGILTLLHSLYDFSLLHARLMSFAAAVTVTWYLNRHHTFGADKDERAFQEWGRYAVVNSIGALLNLGIFLWLVYQFRILADWPILPLAMASAVALVVNFFASRHLAFRHGSIMSDTDQIPVIEALPHGGENLEVMAMARNYNEFLCDLVRRYAGKAESAVDFGAGIGTFSDCLDLAPQQVHCVETEATSRQVIVAKGYSAYANVSELRQGVIPYVFTLNVLEHIKNDAAALGELFRLLAPGGRLFVYVPAFPALFTSMDSYVGHHRRYRLRGLVERVEAAGFVVEKSAYTDALGFFTTLLFKLFHSPEPAPLNPKLVRFYDRALFPLSRLLSVPLGKVLGKNVFVVARKPDEAR